MNKSHPEVLLPGFVCWSQGFRVCCVACTRQQLHGKRSARCMHRQEEERELLKLFCWRFLRMKLRGRDTASVPRRQNPFRAMDCAPFHFIVSTHSIFEEKNGNSVDGQFMMAAVNRTERMPVEKFNLRYVLTQNKAVGGDVEQASWI